MRKKIIAIILCLALCLSAVGCSNEGGGGNGNEQSKVETSAYEVWGAPNTEKILQEAGENSVDYSAVKRDVKINIDTARGEYENAQLIITAKQDIPYYTVQTADLKDASGKVYPKEYISVYNMMYVKVSTIYETNRNGVAGNYPDGILPFDTAVEYGENKIVKDNNQAIFFSFNTPINDKDGEKISTGTYTGEFTLNVGGNDIKVPVSVRVRNIEVSETVHTKSVFLDTWDWSLGEYDSTQDCLDSYHDSLVEYRLSPGYLVKVDTMSEEDAEYYAEKVLKYASNPRFSNYLLPVQTSSLKIVSEPFQMYCEKILEKSFESGLNLLDKAMVYRLDEPKRSQAPYLLGLNETFAQAKEDTINLFNTKREEYREKFGATYDALENKDYPTFDTFLDAACASVDKMVNVVTTKYEEYFDPNTTWCPLFDSYDDPGDLAEYQKQQERWWYGCIIPNAPYCTYHVEDYLLSPRVLGWLQASYDVPGNLYWATNVYTELAGGGYQFIDDPYSYAARYTQYYNGEGFLQYPGARYGLNGPINTIRLEAIRDGLEEYELFYNVKQQYKKADATYGIISNASAIINLIMEPLHAGVQITADTTSFENSRTTLLDFAEFTESGIVFTDYSDDGEGKLNYKVFVPSTAELELSLDAKYYTVQNVTGGKIYSINIDMETYDGGRKVTFTAKKDGGASSFVLMLPGSLTKKDGAFFLNSYKATSKSRGLNLDNTALVNALDASEGQWLRLGVQGYTDDTKNTNTGYRLVRLYDKGLIDLFTNDLSKATIKLYLDQPAGTKVSVKWLVKYNKRVGGVTIATAEINGGQLSEITWNGINTVANISKYGIEYMELQIDTLESGTVVADRNDIYFTSLTLYGN